MGLIYLDSCLLIYALERHEIWGERTTQAIAEKAEARFAISPLTHCECLTGPIRRQDPVLRDAYQAFLDRFELLDMPLLVYVQAAELRALSGLKTPDALHVACAQHHRCDELWTNDDRLTRLSHGLARNILSPKS